MTKKRKGMMAKLSSNEKKVKSRKAAEELVLSNLKHQHEAMKRRKIAAVNRKEKASKTTKGKEQAAKRAATNVSRASTEARTKSATMTERSAKRQVTMAKEKETRAEKHVTHVSKLTSRAGAKLTMQRCIKICDEGTQAQKAIRMKERTTKMQAKAKKGGKLFDDEVSLIDMDEEKKINAKEISGKKRKLSSKSKELGTKAKGVPKKPKKALGGFTHKGCQC
jgi:hypothetical protein